MLWLRALAFLPLAVAAAIRRVERETIARLTDAGATLSERAILLQNDGPLVEFVHRRLVRARVLQPAIENRYYLNEHAYHAFTRRRRQRACVVMGSLVVIVVIVYLTGHLR